MSSARGHVGTLDRLLKICYTRSACHKLSSYRHYHSKYVSEPINQPEAKNVAVLGGGITGLAAAYYLSKGLPNAKITLLESSNRLGGWIRSSRMNIGDGYVVFEQGPRTLRPTVPNGLITLELVSELGLEHRLLPTKKTSAGAQNRFMYYPDHLVRISIAGMSPLKIYTLLSEPLFNGFVPGLISELFKPRRDENLLDESVGSFFSRRYGSAVADNLVSAVVHGIYAGDIYQLSMRAIFPSIWMLESRYGSITRGAVTKIIEGLYPALEEDLSLTIKQSAKINVNDMSAFTFVGGIGELSQALETYLENAPNVKIRRETKVEQIKLLKETSGTKINIAINSRGFVTTPNFTHVISTTSGVNLDKMADIPPLRFTPSVTVMVVNMYFPEADILPQHGFGYLIPRSIPFSENPECALGVVFDSDVTAGQDTVSGTKVTVMMGGHWWADPSMMIPTESDGAVMALNVLRRHLGVTQEPTGVFVSLQRDCIPQYAVGHNQRMEHGSRMLERYEGRLRVAGNSYTGVGFNDCVRAARDVVTGLVDGSGKNGLEKFVGGGPKYVWVSRPSKRK